MKVMIKEKKNSTIRLEMLDFYISDFFQNFCYSTTYAYAKGNTQIHAFTHLGAHTDAAGGRDADYSRNLQSCFA